MITILLAFYSICFVFLVIGLFKPNVSLFWDKKSPTRKKSTLIYGAAMVVLLLLSEATKPAKVEAATSSAIETSTPTFTPAQQDSIAKEEKTRELAEIKQNTIDAPSLMATYEENEVAADENFKGKTFYVTGEVTSIKKDIMDDIYVTLKGDKMFGQVQCFFEDKNAAAQMRKGMQVTFKGTCQGLMMNVLMKDCTLVQ